MKQKILYICLYIILFPIFAFSQNLELIDYVDMQRIQLNEKQQNLVDVITERPQTKAQRLIRINSFVNLKSASSLSLNLFGREVIEVQNKSIRTKNNGATIWEGKTDDPTGTFIFVLSEGNNLSGYIISSTLNYEIEPLANGLHALVEIDGSKFAPESTPVKVDINEKEKNQSANYYSTSDEIDVLVAYTNRAKLNSGNIDNLIDGSSALANGSFSNSSISATLNIVKKVEVNYLESGSFATDLIALRNKTDGEMDNIHTLREQYGADLVVLILGSGDFCGKAFIPSSFSTAFSVVEYSCAGNGLTFAHEIGHNLGAAHDLAHANVSAFSYGHGYKDLNWRTIMASNLLPENRINYWSNPEVDFVVPGQGSVPMGTVTDEDNARVWDERKSTVSGFNPKKPEVSISGPTTMDEGDSETWIANVTGEAPPYTYVWEREINGNSTQVSTSSSYSGIQNDNFLLSVTATDASGGIDYTEIPVVVNDGGGCIFCKTVSNPTKFSIENNYPNPFNPTTKIRYALPEQAQVSLTVYSVTGQKVATLVNGSVGSGFHEVTFEAGAYSSGLYIARISAVGNSGLKFTKELKMLLIK